MLPNGGPASVLDGADYGQHGEVARLPWDVAAVADTEDEVTLELRTMLTRSPLVLAKRVTLNAADPTVAIEEELTNPSAVTQRVMWGQHIVFGPPFLSKRCRIELDDGARVHSAPSIEGLHDRRIDPDQEHRWPHALTPDGRSVDLSLVPSHGEPTEMAYVTDVAGGPLQARRRTRRRHRSALG